MKHKPSPELRALVFARDAGVCTLCARDCTLLETWRDLLRADALAWRRGRVELARHLDLSAHELLATFWNADHHKPRAEGGGDELSNLRTLCVWCHKHETAEFRRRRSRGWRSMFEHPDGTRKTSPLATRPARKPTPITAKCDACGKPATSWCHASCCQGETATCDEHEHAGELFADINFGGPHTIPEEVLDVLDGAIKSGRLARDFGVYKLDDEGRLVVALVRAAQAAVRRTEREWSEPIEAEAAE